MASDRIPVVTHFVGDDCKPDGHRTEMSRPRTSDPTDPKPKKARKPRGKALKEDEKA